MFLGFWVSWMGCRGLGVRWMGGFIVGMLLRDCVWDGGVMVSVRRGFFGMNSQGWGKEDLVKWVDTV